MDTIEPFVLVVLQPYGNRTFSLSREWLRTALPSSIFASALEGDPHAASILIPNPDVTPDVLQLLVDLSQGREPTKHNPNLILAHRYLNIPEMMYYADPDYDRIPNRSNGAAPENREFIERLIVEDRVWPFGYLVFKGYVPTNSDLITAAKSGATDIVRLLLADPKIDPTIGNNAPIIEAAANGHLEVVRLLLANPRVDPTVLGSIPLINAARNGHVEVVRLLLADPRVDPAGWDNSAIIDAARNGHVEIVRLLLANPRVDPTVSKNAPIIEAAKNGHVEVVRLLLADSRVDPTVSKNAPIIEAARNGHAEVVRLLLADPRVDSTSLYNTPIIHVTPKGDVEVVTLVDGEIIRSTLRF